MASPNSPTLQTELEAVNILLDSIGESPVNTLNNPGIVDAVKAQNKLHEVSRHVQLKGWHYNTEKEYDLTINGSGHLVLPANVLKVVVDRRRYPTLDLVQRGLKMYDRCNQTFVFTQNIKVRIVLFLPWEDLPEVAKKYISIRSARIFQNQMVGSELLDKFEQRDEFEALVDLKEAEGDTSGANIFDNEDTLRTIDRIR